MIDALFTATSAVCVTGLIVKDTATHWSLFGKTIIMLLIQVGGLGIMTMTTLFAVLLGRQITLRGRIVAQEALGGAPKSGIARLVLVITLTTLLIEAIGASILFLRFLFAYDFSFFSAAYHAVFHSISAFCNAGFSLYTTSLEQFHSDIFINSVIIILIVLGGLGFGVLIDLFNYRSRRRLSLQSKVVLRTSFALVLLGAVVIFFLERSNPLTLATMPFVNQVKAALFQSVTPRTAGFNTVEIRALHQTSIFLIIILMWIGASPGSTGGGIKTTTFSTLLAGVLAGVKGKSDIELMNRRLPINLVWKALAVAAISTLLIFVVTSTLLATEGMTLQDTLFEVVSAFGTVGLSTGITPKLTSIGRLLITLTMFVGRVGPFTLALALTEREKKLRLRYPEEAIIIG
jgi:trk system potassium uptake protein TrkH